jgi:hypothetical protein
MGMYEDLKNLISAEVHGLVGRSTISNLFEYFSFDLHAVEDSCQILRIRIPRKYCQRTKMTARSVEQIVEIVFFWKEAAH